MATVILIHGIWMNGLDMSLLRWRLIRNGYIVKRFAYASVGKSLRENASELSTFLHSIRATPVHFVAHSLGGLLVRQLFQDYPQQRPGRIVTLGTPHVGSRAARRLSQYSWGRKLLGKSIKAGLLGDAPPWRNEHDIGVIAGSRPLGLGRLITSLPVPNDGTVALDETRLDGMADYIVVNSNHMGLVVNGEVARQVEHFLRYGRFLHRDTLCPAGA